MREEGGRIQGCGGKAAEAGKQRRQHGPAAQPETLPVYYSAPCESTTRAGRSNWAASRTRPTTSVTQQIHIPVKTDTFLRFQAEFQAES